MLSIVDNLSQIISHHRYQAHVNNLIEIGNRNMPFSKDSESLASLLQALSGAQASLAAEAREWLCARQFPKSPLSYK
jgi:hypothetical protein